jgi:hypothetical protein
MPPRDIVETIASRQDYSPDFKDMRLYKYIPVFIYHKRLMKGGQDNSILLPTESKYLGEAYTCTDRYIIRVTDSSLFSAAFNSTEVYANANAKFNKNHVKGEVYALSPRALLNVDKFLENSFMFQREYRNIFLIDQESPIKSSFIPSLRTMMYIARESYWQHFSMNKAPAHNDYRINKWCWMN